MGEVGILDEDDRVELLDGQVVPMTPIGPAHASLVDRLTRLLVRAVGDDAVVRVQNPVRLTPLSEPEPDLAVVRPRADGYAESHPGPDDVVVLVEVADSSDAVDRAVKIPLYADAGVPEVWLIDVSRRLLTVHTDPGEGGYRVVRTPGPDETLALTGPSGTALPVAEILGLSA